MDMSDHSQAPAALNHWQSCRCRLLKRCIMDTYFTIQYVYPSLSQCTNTKWGLFRIFGRVAKINYHLCHVCPSVRPTHRPTVWNNSGPGGHMSVKLRTRLCYWHPWIKFIFDKNQTKITVTLHDNLRVFMDTLFANVNMVVFVTKVNSIFVRVLWLR
jgi:hypothetical protein